MDQRASHIEKVILVQVIFEQTPVEALTEFQELATSTGASILSVMTHKKKLPDAKYFIGSGKAEEIRDAILTTGANLVIFNHVLTPSQERNLEKLLKCRVIDRTQLILDIFARRARSFEGKLQIELALLKHQSTRLVRGWTHLERQRGGIGVRGGPGETQLEVDKRIIRQKIKNITKRLEKLAQQRKLSRRSRHKALVPTVALVGYTNAGKSTLFNKLTGASVFVANQLFATLDTTLRRVDYPEYGAIIFADTVGFIRNLPHDLIESFHATLEEVTAADLLLIVVDATDNEKKLHLNAVTSVLEEINADNIPRLVVYNKTDLISPNTIIQRADDGEIKYINVSAQTGFGMNELIKCIGDVLGRQLFTHQVILNATQTKLRATLYAKNSVVEEKVDAEGNFHLIIHLTMQDYRAYFPEEG